MPDLLIVGNDGGTNIGSSLARAAPSLALSYKLVDMYHAQQGPRWWRSLHWHLLDHRPTRLDAFSQDVVAHCRQERPRLLLSTGIAPLTRPALKVIRGMGIITANYLTDDPWSRSIKSRWFLAALPYYDIVFTPRTAVIADLQATGCKQIEYLPFGYDETLFYPEEKQGANPAPELLFVGGADAERVATLLPLIQAHLPLTLYGDYWDKFSPTRPYTQGHTGPALLRQVTNAAKINLCLVRRANRDGHVMRSFEIPACGGCMLVEDTAEHRDIFGPEGETVLYFDNPSSMVAKAQWLLVHDAERNRLKANLYRHITTAHHTYADRLQQIITVAL